MRVTRFLCRSRQALWFPLRQPTPQAAWNVAFSEVMAATLCHAAREGGTVCEWTDGSAGPRSPDCQHRDVCLCPRLYLPRSDVQKRDFPSPVLVRAAEPDEVEGGFESVVDVVLCGRIATAHEQVIRETMEALARAGFGPPGLRVNFNVANVRVVFDGPLADMAGPAPTADSSVLIELVTAVGWDPARISHARGSRMRTETEEGAGLPLAWLLENVADDLVRWDIEDWGLSDTLGREACEKFAAEASQAAGMAAGRVAIEKAALREEEYGLNSRKSRTGPREGHHPLFGLSGFALLSGDLPAVWPWLLGAVARGAGQQRGKGFGHVRLWRARI